MILLKIAFRNLREHRIKTLIIGTLIALGIAFLVIGNSLMASVTRGIQASYTSNFTGDLILRSPSEEDVAFIGGFGVPPPVVADYPEVVARLEALPQVARHTPLLASAASISQGDETLSFALLWGIEPSSYFRMFPDSFVLTQGERLQDGQQGVLLSQAVIDDVRDEHGIELRVGDAVLLAGQNDVTGTKIREVTIRGIGAFANAAGLLERISFVDAATLRALTGLTAVRVERAGTGAAAPEALSEDALFGGDLIRDAVDSGDAPLDFDNVLGDTSVRERFLALDNDAWHFILLELADGASPAAVARSLDGSGSAPDNAPEGAAGAAATDGRSLRVETWRWAAGFIAELAFGIRTILNVVIGVVAVVAVIIIMNTLVISVTERIAEIGTVRALGGQKSFVRGMITIEVLMITGVFGLVGMAVGALTIGVLNAVGVPASNLFLQIMFGGSELRPVLSLGSLLGSLGVVAVIGVVASLYPTAVALGIAPVQAMQKR